MSKTAPAGFTCLIKHVPNRIRLYHFFLFCLFFPPFTGTGSARSATVKLDDFRLNNPDTVAIYCTISDPDSSPVSLSCYYSTNWGVYWQQASCLLEAPIFDAAHYTTRIRWLSRRDLGIEDDAALIDLLQQSIYFAVVPYDPQKGTPDTCRALRPLQVVAVHSRPVLSLIFNTRLSPNNDPGKFSSFITLTGSTDSHYTCSTVYHDSLRKLEILPDSSFFSLESLTVQIDHALCNRSGLELDGNNDGIAEGDSSDDYFHSFINPAIGDFNQDGTIDFTDCMLHFRPAWQTYSPQADIGPLQGIPPDTRPLPDGIIDYQDLQSFVMMWHALFIPDQVQGNRKRKLLPVVLNQPPLKFSRKNDSLFFPVMRSTEPCTLQGFQLTLTRPTGYDSLVVRIPAFSREDELNHLQFQTWDSMHSCHVIAVCSFGSSIPIQKGQPIIELPSTKDVHEFCGFEITLVTDNAWLSYSGPITSAQIKRPPGRQSSQTIICRFTTQSGLLHLPVPDWLLNSSASFLQMSVFSPTGKLLASAKVPTQGNQRNNYLQFRWKDQESITSGVYLVRFHSPGISHAFRILLP